MELKDTVKLMLSDDYKERLIGEYQQTLNRWNKLGKCLYPYTEFGNEYGVDTVSVRLLKKQYAVMDEYLSILEQIALIDGINIHGEIR